MKNFTKGIITGVVSTVALTSAGVAAIKKKYIDPENDKNEFIENNRKKAARKRVSR